jgi:PadR family transcriptional regulator, regulatory protein PadR
MRVDRELMRGAGPVAVLKLLEAGEKYGYELVELLEQRSKGVLAMGQSTLYPMLYNLESQGLVKSEWRQGDSARGRKYYHLTSKGKKRLAADLDQWGALVEAFATFGILSGQPAPALGGGPR